MMIVDLWNVRHRAPCIRIGTDAAREGAWRGPLQRPPKAATTRLPGLTMMKLPPQHERGMNEEDRGWRMEGGG